MAAADAGWPKRLVEGLDESAGGAPAGVVEPRLLNIGLAGVAWPGVVEAKRPLPPAPEAGVEPVPGAFPVLAPNKFDDPEAPAPPKSPPPVVAGVEPLAAVVVGVLEEPPNRLDEAGLEAPPKSPPGAVPVEAGVVPDPPNSEAPGEAVPAPPNKPPAGFAALLLPEFKPPNKFDWLLFGVLLWFAVPKVKPLAGVEDCALGKMDDVAVAEEDAGAEVPGVLLPPKLNDMFAEIDGTWERGCVGFLVNECSDGQEACGRSSERLSREIRWCQDA